MSTVIRLALVAALVSLATAAHAQTREITKIAGDLYRFQNNFHFSVFLVTPDGVIATDPINAEAATWLKAEIASRFDQPIRYVIYSHDHGDHISGGEVFAADGAVVIAHEQARVDIIEQNRATAVPDITFTDRMNVTLGGKTVELTYVGPSHSDNLIVMHFPDERALFAVDFITVRRLPYQTLNDSYFPGWMEAIQRVEAMDFDILVPGHGPIGAKNDARDHRQYLDDLHAAVVEGVRQGKSLDELKAEITLEGYAGWGQFDAWRTMNIEGMYRAVTTERG